MRNAAFHCEDDVASRLALPLIVGIPLVLTPTEERGRSRKMVLEWFAGSAIALVVFLAEFYVYRHG
jgi:hypothetical protein